MSRAFHIRGLCHLLLAALLASCGKESVPVAPTSTVSPLPPAPLTGSGLLVGAGDIGFCGSPGAEATARLLDGFSGTVFTAGDNAYATGTRSDFLNCYAPSWGRHLGRTRPVAGNHEYGSGAGGYFEYF